MQTMQHYNNNDKEKNIHPPSAKNLERSVFGVSDIKRIVVVVVVVVKFKLLNRLSHLQVISLPRGCRRRQQPVG